jgi:hypothetical protein
MFAKEGVGNSKKRKSMRSKWIKEKGGRDLGALNFEKV